MPYYKDQQGNLYFRDEAFEARLPSGCVRIEDGLAVKEIEASARPSAFTVITLIKIERDLRQIDGGVKVGHHWFLSTERAMSEYNSLLNASVGIDQTTVLRHNWRTMDGAIVDMTPALARQILVAGIAQRCAIDDASQAHIAAVQASDDPAAYDFSVAWPEIFAP